MWRLIYKYSKTMQSANIKITPQQQNIFNLLLEFRQHRNLNTVIRVAGGWVRDKIMGKQSHDIDFALDDMDGETFTLQLKDYCLHKTHGAKISGFGVTKLNPQQSKNLKTATVKINDHQIDIVNLRSEKYTEESRIPTIEIGTPKQDALRRDLTINALFYNIVTQQVQDFTEKGINDIQNGIIRTPLDPYITFKDDPLRILRVFRFAGRFNYKVMPEILEAASSPDIKEFLRVKISKERIGIELTSMLKGPHPQISLGYILNTGLWNIVFQIPENSSLTDQNIINQIPQLSFKYLNMLKQYLTQNPLMTYNLLVNQNLKEDDIKLMLYFCALTYVYQSHTVKQAKGLPVPLIQYIIKNSLKRSNHEALFPLKVNQGSSRILQLISNNQIGQSKFLKWLLNVGQKWEVSLVMTIITHPQHRQKVLNLKEEIVVKKWGQIYRIQPPVDGTYLVKQLGKKGKTIGIVLNNLLMWSILNPTRTLEQAIETLKNEMERFEDPNMYE